MRPPASEAKAARLAGYADELHTLGDVFQGRLDRARCELISIREFRILAFLGEGGFGKVYKAERNGRIEAIKVQDKEKLFPRHIDKTVAEKRFLCAMDSVFITRATGFWKDASDLYLYMEYAAYGDLHRFIASDAISDEQAVKFVAQIVCALEYIHACGIIYRDLKPANCLICEGGRLKIGDFGLAVRASSEPFILAGTPSYCAPEMYIGVPYSEAVDWWSLGVLVYEMLLAKRPFSVYGDTIDDVEIKIKGPLTGVDESSLSEEAKDLLRKLLEKDPSKRAGTKKDGVDEVKRHAWFRNVDFHDVIFQDIQIADLELEPYDGRPANEAIFSNINSFLSDEDFREY